MICSMKIRSLVTENIDFSRNQFVFPANFYQLLFIEINKLYTNLIQRRAEYFYQKWIRNEIHFEISKSNGKKEKVKRQKMPSLKILQNLMQIKKLRKHWWINTERKTNFCKGNIQGKWIIFWTFAANWRKKAK